MALVALGHRLAVEGPLEQARVAPGVAEVVFRAGAEGGGELLAVDEELLVALAPPAGRGFHTCSITPQNRPRPSVLSIIQSGQRSSGSWCDVAVPLAVEMAQAVEGPVERGVDDLELARRGPSRRR